MLLIEKARIRVIHRVTVVKRKRLELSVVFIILLLFRIINIEIHRVRSTINVDRWSKKKNEWVGFVVSGINNIDVVTIDRSIR